MIKISIKKDAIPAIDMDDNQLFLDEDGDMYVRTEDGCVGIEAPSELTPYILGEMDDYDLFPYLERCTPVEGTVKIKVKLS